MTKSIGFIGGGQMAEAILKGLLQSGIYTVKQLQVSEPIERRRRYLNQTYQIKVGATSRDLVKTCEVIILAVKPQVMTTVLTEIKAVVKSQLVISIAAGVPLARYVDLLANPTVPIVRVMPNMPALIQEGVSALCRNNNVSDDQFEFAKILFNSVGTTVTVAEQAMDAVTALSGSGPAYVFSFIESLIDGGVKSGLRREIARELAIQTILGSTRLAKETGEHPAVLRDQVTSPGGTTASGLHVLEDTGFNGIVMSTIEAAFKRSIELGEK